LSSRDAAALVFDVDEDFDRAALALCCIQRR
jgi:hypothetical protein